MSAANRAASPGNRQPPPAAPKAEQDSVDAYPEPVPLDPVKVAKDESPLSSSLSSWGEFCMVCSRFRKMFSFSRVNRMVIPVHRYTGLLYLLHLPPSVFLVTFDFNTYMQTPLWWSMPLCGFIQACSASWYFRYMLPKKMDPGFMSMNNQGRASWFFICENIFFSGILLFAFCYMHPSMWSLAAWNRGNLLFFLMGLAEAWFVFLPYVWRPLFPKTSLRDSNKHRDKNTTEDQQAYYYWSTMAVKIFYNFAKHYVGFFLNYLVFFGRVTPLSSTNHTLYEIMVLGSYMTTGAMFIHTLVFKGYVPNKVGSLMYQGAWPVTVYLYYAMIATVIWPNLDLAILSTIGLALNFLPSLAFFHTYQALLMCLFYVWRNVLANHTSNHLNLANLEIVLSKLPSAFAEVPLALSVLLIFLGAATVLAVHRLPRMCLRANPFYKLAKELKKLRPHAEDDPDKEE